MPIPLTRSTLTYAEKTHALQRLRALLFVWTETKAIKILLCALPVFCIEPCFKEWHSALFRDEEAVNTNSSDSDSD